MERMNETLDLKLNELSANTAEVTGTAGMVNTAEMAEMAESPTAAERSGTEQSGTEQSGTGLDALVRGTDVPQGTVVMAATPIGNTADASARLIALLERADIVAAEDTRRLYALANRLGVHVNGRVVAYHDHNERDKSDGLLDQVETGATVLVVSDAGMPTINDPGLAIVRRAIERGLPVTCAPGPSCAFQDCPPTASAMKDSCRASIPNACNTCVPCVLNAAPSCFTKPCIASTIPWPTCLTCSVRTARWRFAVNLPRILSRSVAEPSRRFARA